MTPLIKNINYGLNNIIQLHLKLALCLTVTADLVILAIQTGKVASAEKHITDAIFPAYDGLFTIMYAD
jgi:hypothetical protein